MRKETTNRLLGAALIVSAALMNLNLAQAQYYTGFENPPFVSGALNNQDSWTSGGLVSVRTAAEIEAELGASGISPEEAVHSGDQALLVSGSGSGITSRRVISGLEAMASVSLNVWVRPLTPRSDVGATNIGNVFVVLEDSSDATAGRAAAFRFGYYDDGSGTKAPHIDFASNVTGTWQNTGLSWDADTWYNAQMDVNFATQTYDFILNGTQINTSPIPFYNGNPVSSLGAVRIYRGSNQAGMIVDDLTIIPEPGVMCLLVLGGCALFLRRKL